MYGNYSIIVIIIWLLDAAELVFVRLSPAYEFYCCATPVVQSLGVILSSYCCYCCLEPATTVAVLVGSWGTADDPCIAVLLSRVVLFTVVDDCRVSRLARQVLLTAEAELVMILLVVVFCWPPTATPLLW